MVAEVLIVGSGAAGVSAALAFARNGIRPVMVDVGIEPSRDVPLQKNFYELRRERDVFDVMIGEQHERIRGLARGARPMPAKLRAPRISFVTRQAQKLSPLNEQGVAVVQSFARGGLANAWGAGLYRTTERDLSGIPARQSELAPYFDLLTAEIGICGQEDDLTPYFGRTTGLQPPLRLSKKANWLLERYRRRRASINASHVFVGRPRLAILSQPHAGRAACDYSNLEFWEPNLPHIYTPRMTLQRLIEDGQLTYRGDNLVESWSRSGDVIQVNAVDVKTGAPRRHTTRHLILAAGAIGSAKLALASRNDFRTRLPLLDNSAVQFPLVLPRFIGSRLQADSFGLTQLNLVYDAPGCETPLQGSILEITSPARSEFFASLPFAAKDNLRMIRMLVPAMLVMQFFFPAAAKQAATMRLSPEGTLDITGTAATIDRGVVKHLVKTLRKLGALTHRSLAVVPPAGQQGIHYAGTLPMSEEDQGTYRCDPQCRLAGENGGVYVVDGSVFPSVPAKNLSFLMMANAMRVADRLSREIRRP